MQHTSKYQFKLIEGTDNFSPGPLNDNMEKVEEQFEAVEEEFSEVMTNLGTIGHNLRVETGSYTGTGTYGQFSPTQLTFELYPVVVMIVCTSSTYASPPCIMMRPAPCSIFSAGASAALGMFITWGEHTVSWYAGNSGANSQANEEGATYHYLALGY